MELERVQHRHRRAALGRRRRSGGAAEGARCGFLFLFRLARGRCELLGWGWVLRPCGWEASVAGIGRQQAVSDGQQKVTVDDQQSGRRERTGTVENSDFHQE